MKKEAGIYLIVILFISLSFAFVSANAFTDFFNKVFGSDNPDLSPDNPDGSNSNQINCLNVYDPVCGIDNKTYSNSCFVGKANTSIKCNQVCPCYIPDPTKKCSDGTSYGECSTNKPLYCKEGELINNCQECGCPLDGQEYSCQIDGSCKLKEPEPIPTPKESYFRFKVTGWDDTFIFRLNDTEKIKQARGILNGTIKDNIHVAGIVTEKPMEYNSPWSYYLKSDSITFFKQAIELCDSDIKNLEQTLVDYCKQYPPGKCRWCPWGSILIEEVDINNKCSDGTVYGSCSFDKPKFCEKQTLTLKDDCNFCGCPIDNNYTCQESGKCLLTEPEPIKYIESFERDMAGWTTDHHLHCEQSSPPCSPLIWNISRTTQESFEGDYSLKYYMDGTHDDGVIWVEKDFDVKPNTNYDLNITFNLWGYEDDEVGRWTVVSYFGDINPEIEEDFSSVGWTFEKVGWKEYSYKTNVKSGNDGKIWAAFGVSAVFETWRTHYLDYVIVSINESKDSSSGLILSKDQATEKAVTENKIQIIDSVELIEENEKQIYVIDGTRKKRLFFIIPVDVNIQTQVDSQTGEIISTKKPWWSFLAW